VMYISGQLDASSLSSSHVWRHTLDRLPLSIRTEKKGRTFFVVCVCGRSGYFRHLTESRKVVTWWSYFHECLAHLSFEPSPNGLPLIRNDDPPPSRPSTSHVRQVRMWAGARNTVTSRIARWPHFAVIASKICCKINKSERNSVEFL
jgi:hypothetical protein